MNFTIRQADEPDTHLIAHLHIEGWKAAYADLVNNDQLKIPTLEDRMAQWKKWLTMENSGCFLAFSNSGEPAGFASYGRLQTPLPGLSPIRPLYSGEIYGLYLMPQFYRQGLGRTLMKESALALAAMKHRSLCLWTLEPNKRSRLFYEALGGQRVGKHIVEIGTQKVKELCYGWRDTSVLTG